MEGEPAGWEAQAKRWTLWSFVSVVSAVSVIRVLESGAADRVMPLGDVLKLAFREAALAAVIALPSLLILWPICKRLARARESAGPRGGWPIDRAE